MNREELELEIVRLQAELTKIRVHERAVRDIDMQLRYAQIDGVSEEELLGIIDLLYHPENYEDLTD